MTATAKWGERYPNLAGFVASGASVATGVFVTNWIGAHADTRAILAQVCLERSVERSAPGKVTRWQALLPWSPPIPTAGN